MNSFSECLQKKTKLHLNLQLYLVVKLLFYSSIKPIPTQRSFNKPWKINQLIAAC